QADADVFSSCSGAPDKAKAPHAYRWFVHIAAIKGVRSLNSAPAAPAAAPASTSRVTAAAAPAAAADDDDDDDDDLFGDDEEEEAAKPAEKSRAEKMAEAKSAKDANKKVDRSQIVFEVKPWEAGADLKGLFEKIREEKIDGLVWGEAYKLVPVAFGVKKLVLSCVVVDSKVSSKQSTE
ncbi:unnamed protein product, partial [Laminaria digitata]